MNAAATSHAHAVPGERSELEPQWPFQRIVCGIDGSRSAHEAARQAAALVAPGGRLELVAVTYEWGVGVGGGATLTHQNGQTALAEIADELRRTPAEIVTRVVAGSPPWKALLYEADGADLLVIARHSRSRFGGIALGRTATNVAHRASLPVLIAGQLPKGRAFPGRILVAADGPGHPERAVRLAGMIARGADGEVTLLRLDWSRRAKRPALAKAIAELAELGVEPVEILVGGTPHREIPREAEREGASLVVVGSRGLTGARALSSVSERVAHETACSVLIVRPPAPGV